MQELNQADIMNLALGSTFLATGGGFPFEQKLKKLTELNQTNSLNIINSDELDDDSFVCAVCGIGSADNDGVFDLEKALEVGLSQIEGLTNKRIQAIIPGEIGIENIVFDIASQINLPVLDGDTAGGRAVPEMKQDTFVLANESILPAVIVTLEGKTKVVNLSEDEKNIEKIARKMAVESPGKTVLLFSHIKPMKKIREIASLNSLTTAINVGKILQMKTLRTIQDEFRYYLKGEIIMKEIVIDVVKQNDMGFLVQKVKLGNGQELVIKNEIIGIIDEKKIIQSVPDSICIIRQKKFTPIHSSELQPNDKILIFRIPPIEQWKSDYAQEIFGRNYLQQLL